MARHIAPKTFRTKGDAQAWLAEERRLISLQQWSSPRARAIHAEAGEADRQARTLSAYAEAWLEARVTSLGAGLRPATKAGYRNSLDVHILPEFGHLPLDEITTAAIRQWRGRFSAQGRDAAGAKAYGVLKVGRCERRVREVRVTDSRRTRSPARCGAWLPSAGSGR